MKRWIGSKVHYLGVGEIFMIANSCLCIHSISEKIFVIKENYICKNRVGKALCHKRLECMNIINRIDCSTNCYDP